MRSQDISKFKWKSEDKLADAKNRQDSSKWDSKIFKQDLIKYHRIKTGFFPVPYYSLIKNNDFYGVGYDGNFKGIEFKNHEKIVYIYFYFNNQVKNDYTFFSIAINISSDNLTQEISSNNIQVDITSRNHPNYLATGKIFNGQSEIVFQAFYTGDDHSYAIVNQRLFDLSLGKLILIKSINDGSLRALQLDFKGSDRDEEIEKIITNNVLFYSKDIN
ncbi:hypothetical protein [Epilithonimonas hominis]|uniref:Uncharacterized protein n=1 Tax=Epilithonimonas hominis TaxID=420404 RepID=A0A3N0XCJ3_9FLAO|nr:hypothetical protein [Epilithonimonas hominis]ROI14511.1 hypothetical protein EGH73_02770 [Epilithonimonas hominis]